MIYLMLVDYNIIIFLCNLVIMKYVVYNNDLKYGKNREIDVDKVIWYDETVKENFNNDLDSLEYRITECKNSDWEYLDLSNMELKHIPRIPSKCFDKTKYIFLNNNKFAETLDLTKFIMLEVADISDNNINNILFTNKLKELSCKNTKIKNINTGNLEILDCIDSKVEIINIGEKLISLYCCNNNISYLSSSNTLKKLSCSKNPIDKLEKYPMLEYLDISETKIKNIKNHSNLICLCANNTLLTKLPILNNLENLEIIDTNIETVDYYPKFKIILCSSNSTKNISEKYKNIVNIKSHKRFITFYRK